MCHGAAYLEAMAYLPLDDADRRAMLEVVGAGSADDLFGSVPATLRNPPLELPPRSASRSWSRS